MARGFRWSLLATGSLPRSRLSENDHRIRTATSIAQVKNPAVNANNAIGRASISPASPFLV